MNRPIHCYVDGDSIAYSAGYCEYHAEMEMAVDGYVRDILTATGANKLFIYVENPGGKANYRRQVAVTQEYKGNRKDKEKPAFMVDAKRYMRQKYKAEYVTYMESEDAASIGAHDHGLENSIISCIDKDLYQVPGRFYDYRTKQSFIISPEVAEYNLWKQILTGDSVDGIPGLRGIGPKKAEALLTGVDSYAQATIDAYKAHGHPYSYLVEQSRLIYILRRRGEVFTPCTEEEYYGHK